MMFQGDRLKNGPSVRTRLEDEFREAIATGRFRSGQRLKERELCAHFNVSRTSVREVLRKFESEGLVHIVPNRGPSVAVLTLDDVRNLYAVRAVLEGLACSLFAQHASKSEIDQLTSVFERLAAMPQGASEQATSAKEEFYDVLFSGCRNPVLFETLQRLRGRIALLRVMTLAVPGRLAKSVRELEALIAAIRARSADAACELGAHHVRQAGEVAMALLRQREKNAAGTAALQDTCGSGENGAHVRAAESARVSYSCDD